MGMKWDNVYETAYQNGNNTFKCVIPLLTYSISECII